jgi:hypothetical protein
MSSENIIKISEPSMIDGDSLSSSICLEPGSCGTKKSNYECSGGYPCFEDSDNDDNESKDTYKYPAGAPLPDNKNKVPKICDIPQINSGIANEDDFVPLNIDQKNELTTKAWDADIQYLPLKHETMGLDTEEFITETNSMIDGAFSPNNRNEIVKHESPNIKSSLATEKNGFVSFVGTAKPTKTIIKQTASGSKIFTENTPTFQSHIFKIT